MQRRRQDCETLWFDETWAAFAGGAAVADVVEKLRHSRFVLPHREQLPHHLLAAALGARRAAEAGVEAEAAARGRAAGAAVGVAALEAPQLEQRRRPVHTVARQHAR